MGRLMRISDHFTLSELTTTESRDAEILECQSNPPALILSNLRNRLAPVLEAIRAKIAGPVIVTSGYRCARLNRAIGGSPTSVHMLGLAADFHVPGANLVHLYETIVDLDLPEVDQVIFEFGRWVHVGLAPEGKVPRHQRLMIFEPRRYLPWDPKDKRVEALREAL